MSAPAPSVIHVERKGSGRAVRMLRRSMISVLAAISLTVPAIASAAVFEGSQTDPLGDVLISALPSVTLPNGGPPHTGFGTMDLTGVSVRYDSSVGLLSITYFGSNFVETHSGTSFYGSILSAAHAGPGQCRSANDNLYFNGTSGTGSGGGPGHGTATLNISSDDNPILAKQITGTVSFPVDWPNYSQVATFTFLDNGLRNHSYLCSAYLDANFKDYGNSESDNTDPFCIVAGCFDPLESATPPPVASLLLELSRPTLDRTSYSPGDTITSRAELINPNSSTVTAKRALITARPPGSTHANGPIKYDFPAETNISLDHGDVWVSSGSFTLPSNAPLGRYDVYLTYQKADGIYHDGLSNSFDVTVDGSPLPFDTGPPTVNATVTNTPGASVIDGRCSILPVKIKATTARMKLMQRASHKGSASHRRAVTRQVRVLASHRTSLRATYKAVCT